MTELGKPTFYPFGDETRPPWASDPKHVLTLASDPADLKCRSTVPQAVVIELVRLEALLTQLSVLTKVSLDTWTAESLAEAMANPSGPKGGDKPTHVSLAKHKITGVLVAFGDSGYSVTQDGRASIFGKSPTWTLWRSQSVMVKTWLTQYHASRTQVKTKMSVAQVVDVYCQLCRWSLADWATLGMIRDKQGVQVPKAAIPLVWFAIVLNATVPWKYATGGQVNVSRLRFDEPASAAEILETRLPLATTLMTTNRRRIFWLPDRLHEMFEPSVAAVERLVFSDEFQDTGDNAFLFGAMRNSVTNFGPRDWFQSLVEGKSKAAAAAAAAAAPSAAVPKTAATVKPVSPAAASSIVPKVATAAAVPTPGAGGDAAKSVEMTAEQIIAQFEAEEKEHKTHGRHLDVIAAHIRQMEQAKCRQDIARAVSAAAASAVIESESEREPGGVATPTPSAASQPGLSSASTTPATTVMSQEGVIGTPSPLST